VPHASPEPPPHPETLLVTAGRPIREPGAALAPPVQPSVTFVQGGPDGYGRDDVPGARPLEAALGALEGGTAVAFSSGMAAAAAVLDREPLGSVVGIVDPAYSGVHRHLRRLHSAGRITVRTLDPDDLDYRGLDLLWLETIGNPMVQAVDLVEVLAAARAAGAVTVVDNTLATPLRRRPLLDGADIVVHSATKLIGGHADLLLGTVVTDETRAEDYRDTRRVLGSVPSPWDCWLALRGLRTLAVRLDRAEATARLLAHRLNQHPQVEAVHYPGFGSVLAIELPTADRADAVCATTRLWVPATSLGGDESTVERRRRWPSESRAVPESLLRLSVGLEHPEDLWTDLAAALD
jgi:cystathionine gamma-synthase